MERFTRIAGLILGATLLLLEGAEQVPCAEGPLLPPSAHGGRWLFADDFDTDPLAEKRWTFGRGGNCEYGYDTAEHFRSKGSLRAGPGDAMWGRWFCQQRLSVKPGGRYRVTGYIKTKGVRHGVPSIGLSFYRGDRVAGGFSTRNVYDSDWTPVEAEGVAPPKAEWAQVTCEASGLEGLAWFDTIQVLELPQAGVWIEHLKVTGSPHGLSPGQPMSAEVVLTNPLRSTRRLQLHWGLTDLEGNLLWQQTKEIALTDRAEAKAQVGTSRRLGYFHVRLDVMENGIRLAMVESGVPVLPPLPQKPLPHVPFTVLAANQYSLVKGGLTEHEATWRKFARMMRAAGVTNLRIWNHWTERIHPSKGQVKLVPSVYDLACRVAREEGLRVSMVFWLVPPWAKGQEEDWQCYHFMQAAAKYYAQFGVDRFEIDNEPEASQRYLDRLKAGYLGVKRVNPAAEVLMAGLFWYHRRPNEGLFTVDGNLFNALGELAAPYTDRVNWHEYYQSPPEQPLSRDLAVHRSLCDTRFAGSYGNSLYMTETAYCAFYPGPAGHVTELEQAEWGVREYLLTLQDNYLDMDNKAFWYYYLDDNAAPYYAAAMSGLLRIDMSPKPSYIAMRNLASLIEGAEPVGEIDVGEPLRVFVLRRGAEPVIALWSASEPGEVVLNVGKPKVTLIDLFGNRQEVVTAEGKLAIHLNAAVQYVLGADPTTVFVPALADQLLRLHSDLSSLSWHEARTVLEQTARAARSLLEKHSPIALGSLADAAERVVTAVVEEIESGKLTVREAGPRFALLRIADACRIGRVLLDGGDRQPAKAVAQAEELERQASAAVGLLAGQIRSRVFLQLGKRRLARARWQEQQGWDAAVNTETARLAARGLRLALRLSKVEPSPRLDVWLSSPRYELRAAGAVEFAVAVHNASDEAVEGEFVLQSPSDWQVRAEASTFTVEPQQRLVVPFHAQPGVGSKEPGVLRISARVGGHLTTPIAFGLEVVPAVSVRWYAEGRTLDLEVRNGAGQPLPECVLMADWAMPRYVSVPSLPAGQALVLRLATDPAFASAAKALPYELVSPELHFRGEALQSDARIPAARPVEGEASPLPTGQWLIVGPFDNPQETPGVAPQPDKGHDIDYLHEHGGETAIVPALKMAHKSTVAPGGMAAWQEYPGSGDWVDLEGFFGKTDYRAAYMATAIQSEVSRLAVLETGSDDGVKVYHDGRKVWDFARRRAAAKAQDRTVVRLHPGTNRFLLKCFDAQGEWILSFRAVAAVNVSLGRLS